MLRAEDRRFGRVVAIKELRAERTSEGDLLLREAVVTAKLQHPGTRLVTSGTDGTVRIFDLDAPTEAGAFRRWLGSLTEVQVGAADLAGHGG